MSEHLHLAEQLLVSVIPSLVDPKAVKSVTVRGQLTSPSGPGLLSLASFIIRSSPYISTHFFPGDPFSSYAIPALPALSRTLRTAASALRAAASQIADAESYLVPPSRGGLGASIGDDLCPLVTPAIWDAAAAADTILAVTGASAARAAIQSQPGVVEAVVDNVSAALAATALVSGGRVDISARAAIADPVSIDGNSISLNNAAAIVGFYTFIREWRRGLLMILATLAPPAAADATVSALLAAATPTEPLTVTATEVGAIWQGVDPAPAQGAEMFLAPGPSAGEAVVAPSTHPGVSRTEWSELTRAVAPPRTATAVDDDDSSAPDEDAPVISSQMRHVSANMRPDGPDANRILSPCTTFVRACAAAEVGPAVAQALERIAEDCAQLSQTVSAYYIIDGPYIDMEQAPETPGSILTPITADARAVSAGLAFLLQLTVLDAGALVAPSGPSARMLCTALTAVAGLRLVHPSLVAVAGDIVARVTAHVALLAAEEKRWRLEHARSRAAAAAQASHLALIATVRSCGLPVTPLAGDAAGPERVACSFASWARSLVESGWMNAIRARTQLMAFAKPQDALEVFERVMEIEPDTDVNNMPPLVAAALPPNLRTHTVVAAAAALAEDLTSSTLASAAANAASTLPAGPHAPSVRPAPSSPMVPLPTASPLAALSEALAEAVATVATASSPRLLTAAVHRTTGPAASLRHALADLDSSTVSGIRDAIAALVAADNEAGVSRGTFLCGMYCGRTPDTVSASYEALCRSLLTVLAASLGTDEAQGASSIPDAVLERAARAGLTLDCDGVPPALVPTTGLMAGPSGAPVPVPASNSVRHAPVSPLPNAYTALYSTCPDTDIRELRAAAEQHIGQTAAKWPSVYGVLSPPGLRSAAAPDRTPVYSTDTAAVSPTLAAVLTHLTATVNALLAAPLTLLQSPDAAVRGRRLVISAVSGLVRRGTAARAALAHSGVHRALFSTAVGLPQLTGPACPSPAAAADQLVLWSIAGSSAAAALPKPALTKEPSPVPTETLRVLEFLVTSAAAAPAAPLFELAAINDMLCRCVPDCSLTLAVLQCLAVIMAQGTPAARAAVQVGVPVTLFDLATTSAAAAAAANGHGAYSCYKNIELLCHGLVDVLFGPAAIAPLTLDTSGQREGAFGAAFEDVVAESVLSPRALDALLGMHMMYKPAQKILHDTILMASFRAAKDIFDLPDLRDQRNNEAGAVLAGSAQACPVGPAAPAPAVRARRVAREFGHRLTLAIVDTFNQNPKKPGELLEITLATVDAARAEDVECAPHVQAFLIESGLVLQLHETICELLNRNLVDDAQARTIALLTTLHAATTGSPSLWDVVARVLPPATLAATIARLAVPNPDLVIDSSSLAVPPARPLDVRLLRLIADLCTGDTMYVAQPTQPFTSTYAPALLLHLLPYFSHAARHFIIDLLVLHTEGSYRSRTTIGHVQPLIVLQGMIRALIDRMDLAIPTPGDNEPAPGLFVVEMDWIDYSSTSDVRIGTCGGDGSEVPRVKPALTADRPASLRSTPGATIGEAVDVAVAEAARAQHVLVPGAGNTHRPSPLKAFTHTHSLTTAVVDEARGSYHTMLLRHMFAGDDDAYMVSAGLKTAVVEFDGSQGSLDDSDSDITTSQLNLNNDYKFDYRAYCTDEAVNGRAARIGVGVDYYCSPVLMLRRLMHFASAAGSQMISVAETKLLLSFLRVTQSGVRRAATSLIIETTARLASGISLTEPGAQRVRASTAAGGASTGMARSEEPANRVEDVEAQKSVEVTTFVQLEGADAGLLIPPPTSLPVLSMPPPTSTPEFRSSAFAQVMTDMIREKSAQTSVTISSLPDVDPVTGHAVTVSDIPVAPTELDAKLRKLWGQLTISAWVYIDPALYSAVPPPESCNCGLGANIPSPRLFSFTGVDGYVFEIVLIAGYFVVRYVDPSPEEPAARDAAAATQSLASFPGMPVHPVPLRRRTTGVGNNFSTTGECSQLGPLVNYVGSWVHVAFTVSRPRTPSSWQSAVTVKCYLNGKTLGAPVALRMPITRGAPLFCLVGACPAIAADTAFPPEIERFAVSSSVGYVPPVLTNYDEFAPTSRTNSLSYRARRSIMGLATMGTTYSGRATLAATTATGASFASAALRGQLRGRVSAFSMHFGALGDSHIEALYIMGPSFSLREFEDSAAAAAAAATISRRHPSDAHAANRASQHTPPLDHFRKVLDRCLMFFTPTVPAAADALSLLNVSYCSPGTRPARATVPLKRAVGRPDLPDTCLVPERMLLLPGTAIVGTLESQRLPSAIVTLGGAHVLLPIVRLLGLPSATGGRAIDPALVARVLRLHRLVIVRSPSLTAQIERYAPELHAALVDTMKMATSADVRRGFLPPGTSCEHWARYALTPAIVDEVFAFVSSLSTWSVAAAGIIFSLFAFNPTFYKYAPVETIQTLFTKIDGVARATGGPDSIGVPLRLLCPLETIFTGFILDLSRRRTDQQLWTLAQGSMPDSPIYPPISSSSERMPTTTDTISSHTEDASLAEVPKTMSATHERAVIAALSAAASIVATSPILREALAPFELRALAALIFNLTTHHDAAILRRTLAFLVRMQRRGAVPFSLFRRTVGGMFESDLADDDDGAAEFSKELSRRQFSSDLASALAIPLHILDPSQHLIFHATNAGGTQKKFQILPGVDRTSLCLAAFSVCRLLVNYSSQTNDIIALADALACTADYAHPRPDGALPAQMSYGAPSRKRKLVKKLPAAAIDAPGPFPGRDSSAVAHPNNATDSELDPSSGILSMIGSEIDRSIQDMAGVAVAPMSPPVVAPDALRRRQLATGASADFDHYAPRVRLGMAAAARACSAFTTSHIAPVVIDITTAVQPRPEPQGSSAAVLAATGVLLARLSSVLSIHRGSTQHASGMLLLPFRVVPRSDLSVNAEDFFWGLTHDEHDRIVARAVSEVEARATPAVASSPVGHEMDWFYRAREPDVAYYRQRRSGLALTSASAEATGLELDVSSNNTPTRSLHSITPAVVSVLLAFALGKHRIDETDISFMLLDPFADMSELAERLALPPSSPLALRPGLGIDGALCDIAVPEILTVMVELLGPASGPALTLRVFAIVRNLLARPANCVALLADPALTVVRSLLCTLWQADTTAALNAEELAVRAAVRSAAATAAAAADFGPDMTAQMPFVHLVPEPYSTPLAAVSAGGRVDETRFGISPIGRAGEWTREHVVALGELTAEIVGALAAHATTRMPMKAACTTISELTKAVYDSRRAISEGAARLSNALGPVENTEQGPLPETQRVQDIAAPLHAVSYAVNAYAIVSRIVLIACSAVSLALGGQTETSARRCAAPVFTLLCNAEEAVLGRAFAAAASAMPLTVDGSLGGNPQERIMPEIQSPLRATRLPDHATEISWPFDLAGNAAALLAAPGLLAGVMGWATENSPWPAGIDSDEVKTFLLTKLPAGSPTALAAGNGIALSSGAGVRGMLVRLATAVFREVAIHPELAPDFVPQAAALVHAAAGLAPPRPTNPIFPIDRAGRKNAGRRSARRPREGVDTSFPGDFGPVLARVLICALIRINALEPEVPAGANNDDLMILDYSIHLDGSELPVYVSSDGTLLFVSRSDGLMPLLPTHSVYDSDGAITPYDVVAQAARDTLDMASTSEESTQPSRDNVLAMIIGIMQRIFTASFGHITHWAGESLRPSIVLLKNSSDATSWLSTSPPAELTAFVRAFSIHDHYEVSATAAVTDGAGATGATAASALAAATAAHGRADSTWRDEASSVVMHLANQRTAFQAARIRSASARAMVFDRFMAVYSEQMAQASVAHSVACANWWQRAARSLSDSTNRPGAWRAGTASDSDFYSTVGDVVDASGQHEILLRDLIPPSYEHSIRPEDDIIPDSDASNAAATALARDDALAEQAAVDSAQRLRNFWALINKDELTDQERPRLTTNEATLLKQPVLLTPAEHALCVTLHHATSPLSDSGGSCDILQSIVQRCQVAAGPPSGAPRTESLLVDAIEHIVVDTPGSAHGLGGGNRAAIATVKVVLIKHNYAIPGRLVLDNMDVVFDFYEGAFDDAFRSCDTTERRNTATDILHSRESLTLGQAKTSEHHSRRWPLACVTRVRPMRHLLRDVGLQLDFADGTAAFFAFSREGRSTVWSHLRSRIGGQMRRQPPTWADTGESLLHSITETWVRGGMSNFDYLMAVNDAAGRTRENMDQWPVFPWVLRNYTDSHISLNKPENFRNLEYPMGAQQEVTRRIAASKYQAILEMPVEPGQERMEPFHWAVHYSSAAVVLFYMIRMAPYTALAVDLQGGHFDHGDRCFNSLPQTYNQIVNDVCDNKEAIPELYTMPELYQNTNHVRFPMRQSVSRRMNTVELPPWAGGSAQRCCRIMRAALESDYVTANLHHWIDLIFGCEQRGERAVEKFNIFPIATYSGLDPLSIAVPVYRNSLVESIAAFGQTPPRLFREPHPARVIMPRIACRTLRAHLHLIDSVDLVVGAIMEARNVDTEHIAPTQAQAAVNAARLLVETRCRTYDAGRLCRSLNRALEHLPNTESSLDTPEGIAAFLESHLPSRVVQNKIYEPSCVATAFYPPPIPGSPSGTSPAAGATTVLMFAPAAPPPMPPTCAVNPRMAQNITDHSMRAACLLGGHPSSANAWVPPPRPAPVAPEQRGGLLVALNDAGMIGLYSFMPPVAHAGTLTPPISPGQNPSMISATLTALAPAAHLPIVFSPLLPPRYLRTCTAITRDGRYLFVGGLVDSSVGIIDLNAHHSPGCQGRLVQRLSTFRAPPTVVRLLHGGRLLLTAGADSSASIWRLSVGSSAATSGAISCATPVVPTPMAFCAGHSSSIIDGCETVGYPALVLIDQAGVVSMHSLYSGDFIRSWETFKGSELLIACGRTRGSSVVVVSGVVGDETFLAGYTFFGVEIFRTRTPAVLRIAAVPVYSKCFDHHVVTLMLPDGSAEVRDISSGALIRVAGCSNGTRISDVACDSLDSTFVISNDGRIDSWI